MKRILVTITLVMAVCLTSYADSTRMGHDETATQVVQATAQQNNTQDRSKPRSPGHFDSKVVNLDNERRLSR